MATRCSATAASTLAAVSLYKDPGYDAFRDFAPIINAGVSPNMMFVHPSFAANNLQELIAVGKKQKLFVWIRRSRQHAASHRRALAEADGGPRRHAYPLQQRRAGPARRRLGSGADRSQRPCRRRCRSSSRQDPRYRGDEPPRACRRCRTWARLPRGLSRLRGLHVDRFFRADRHAEGVCRQTQP